MKSEWDFSGFEFSNLKDTTVARIEWILLDPLWFRFVPKTVGKSKPSLYIGWNIPEHVDSEEGDDLESAGIIMQLTSDSWYEFKLGDARNNYPPPKGVVLAKRPYKGLDWGGKLKGIGFWLYARSSY